MARHSIDRRWLAITMLAASTALADVARAASFSSYDSDAAFATALSGSPVGTVHVQDFDGYAAGTDLAGVEFLPGIRASSNLDVIQAFDPLLTGDRRLFAFSNAPPNERVELGIFTSFELTAPYLAVGFAVSAWDPASIGPAVARVHFLDGSSVDLERFPTNATESEDSFFGVIADVPIVAITWFENEDPTLPGGSEEVAFDDFVAAEVPEPGTAFLLAAGFAALARWRRSSIVR